MLRLEPVDRPELLMWTFGGMLGYHGFNVHGVAHFVNSLGGGPGWKFALSHYPLKRLILEQRTVADVVQLMNRVPVCSNGNYVLCDGAGSILDVELNSDGPQLIEDDGAGFLVHSNHYLCGPHACQANFDQSLEDSFPRLDRMRALIAGKFRFNHPRRREDVPQRSRQLPCEHLPPSARRQRLRHSARQWQNRRSVDRGTESGETARVVRQPL